MVEPADPYLPSRTPSRRARPLPALAIATVGVLLAGVVSVAAMAASSAGTPEDAVNAMLAAARTGDLAGAIDHLDPAERDAIAPALIAIVDDLKTDHVLSGSADLHHLGFVSADFGQPTLTTESLRPDVTAVSVTGGSVKLHVDLSRLPVNPLLAGLVGKAVAPTDETRPLGGPGATSFPVVTVRRGGQWYVSLGYTAAEHARRSAGLPAPAPGDAVAAKGATSPENLVRDLVTAAATGDARRAVELTAPDEGAALHDYAPLLLAKLAPKGNVAVHATLLDLSTSDVPGGRMVTVTDARVELGAGRTVEVTPQGCLKTSGLDLPAPALCTGQGVNPLATVGVVAVERDGAWYLSPYRTVLDSAERSVRTLDVTKLGGLLAGLGSGGAGVLGGLLPSTGGGATLGGLTAGATPGGLLGSTPKPGSTRGFGVLRCAASRSIAGCGADAGG